jgi:hypothetical protein
MDTNSATDRFDALQSAERLWAELTDAFPAKEILRVKGLLDVWSGQREPVFSLGNPWCGGCSCPILPTAPWLDAKDLSFKSLMESLYPALREKLTRATHDDRIPLRPYGVSPDAPEDVEVNPHIPKGWKQLLFYNGYQFTPIEKNVALFPEVSQLIDFVLGHDQLIQEFGLLVLEPQSRIGPHTDIENYIVTCQMGLRVPDKCGIRAGGEERNWKEGECLLFDNSFSHEVWNDDPRRRESC